MIDKHTLYQINSLLEDLETTVKLMKEICFNAHDGALDNKQWLYDDIDMTIEMLQHIKGNWDESN